MGTNVVYLSIMIIMCISSNVSVICLVSLVMGLCGTCKLAKQKHTLQLFRYVATF